MRCRGIVAHENSLMQTRICYNDCEMILFYKSHILSYLEYRTAAFYHARTSVFEPLDRIQQRLLSNIGIRDSDAAIYFNLLPLSVRRDIAMLGVIHRAVLRLPPCQLHELFVRDLRGIRRSARVDRHDLQILEFPCRLALVGRSCLAIDCRER